MAAHENPLTELEQRLIAIADDRQFKLVRNPPVQYYCEFEHSGVVVYLDRQRTKRNIIAVFLHPETDLSRLPLDIGLQIPTEFRHADGMTRFPKKINRGKQPSTYGYSVVCGDITAFGRLLDALKST